MPSQRPRPFLLVLALVISAVAARPALALEDPWWGQEISFTPAYTDFGGTGLLQMPNARMQEDGQIHIGVSNVQPYRRLFINLQGLPWLEAGFRITQITNRIETGSLQFGNAQSFYDRGIDLKARLVRESAAWPEIAVGFRDLGGTNLFASEYLVASRRIYNIDFTAGLAWGNMGSRGGIENPLTWLSSRFKDRSGNAEAGSVNLNRFFGGESIALFGGIEYITPLDGLRLVLEYDANSYQDEPLGNAFEVTTPLNAGVKYAPYTWLQLAAGIERGTDVMLRASLTQSLTQKGALKKLDPAPAPVGPRPAPLPVVTPFDLTQLRTPCTADAALRSRADLVRIEGSVYTIHLYSDCRLSSEQLTTVVDNALQGFENIPKTYKLTLVVGGEAIGPESFKDINNSSDAYSRFLARHIKDTQVTAATVADFDATLIKQFAENGFTLEAADLDQQTLTFWVRQGKLRDMPRAFGRAARIAAAHAPGQVESIRVVAVENGLPILETRFSRRDIERAAANRLTAAEAWQGAQIATPDRSMSDARFIHTAQYPDLDLSLSPGYRQNFGGPDAYYVFQVYADAGANLEFAPGLMIDAKYGINIYNTFNELQQESNSQLPRVRTNIKEYLQQGDSGLNQLDVNYLFPIARDWYGKASAGIFELMFGGAGGEVLYAPYGQPWAVGGEFYWVKQRDFDAGFDFLPYETTTGHVSLYYDLPFDGMTGKLHAGRYLAGDDGVTFEVSRGFDSGVEVGVFATLTDVPAEKFGEGSFDKGFYINFPFDMFSLTSSRARRNFVFRPTTRDGGQRVGVGYRLYGLVKDYRQRDMEGDWRDVFN
jgi:hypothetical protein